MPRPSRFQRLIAWLRRQGDPTAQLVHENAELRDRLKWFESKVAEHNRGQDRTLIWECECGHGHYLKIHRMADPKYGLDSYLSVVSSSRYPEISVHPDRFWSWLRELGRRLRFGWHVLRGGSHEQDWFELLLSPEKARSIAGVLEEEARFDESWPWKKGREE